VVSIDLVTGKTQPVASLGDGLSQIAWSPDGNAVAVSFDHGRLVIMDCLRWKEIKHLRQDWQSHVGFTVPICWWGPKAIAAGRGSLELIDTHRSQILGKVDQSNGNSPFDAIEVVGGDNLLAASGKRLHLLKNDNFNGSSITELSKAITSFCVVDRPTAKRNSKTLIAAVALADGTVWLVRIPM
jgi:hypothetical protein